MNAAIRKALEVLSEPGQIIELRVIRGKLIRSGYFNELDRAAEAAAKLNGTSSVYQTLNPCDPALLARAANRIVEYPAATTSDRDILRRVWLPIDFDPVRPAGVSSTEAEHDAAIARAREVSAHLRSQGWPEPLIADSGNGAHLLYRIVLPNDDESTELLKRCLQGLALRFGDDLVGVDEKVFNAARIWKVYGTIACKGDSTPERPHRQAKVLQAPDKLEAVSLDHMTALAGTSPNPSPGDAGYAGGERFDLERWISDRGLDVDGPDPWGGGRKWIFRICPWNSGHQNRSAYIVQLSSGAIAAGCQHDGCKGNNWAALRALYEPGHWKAGPHQSGSRDESQQDAGTGTSAGGPDCPNGSTSYPPIPPLDKLRIDPRELRTARLTPRCIVDKLIYADVACTPGPGGTGKTTLALYEAVHIVLGRRLYGLEVLNPGPVAFITAEDRREILVARLDRIIEAMGLSQQEQAKVCGGITIWDVTGSVCRLTELDGHGNVALTGLADAIVERFREEHPALVLLDPVISFGAGERLINDNEHSLILAARRIVKGLACCVRLISHVGQDAARAMTLDQYASRGGSALPDGSRMVTVLQPWGEADRDKLTPPIGFTLACDEDCMVLARPKLSFVPKHQRPHIWIKRRGYDFEYFTATPADPEAEARARAVQVERYLIDQLARGARHTKTDIEGAGVMPQKKLRAALSSLLAEGRVVYAPLPEELRHGGRKEYLHPVAATPSNAEGHGDGVGQKNIATPSPDGSVSTPSSPYRKNSGDGVVVTGFSQPACHSVNGGGRGSNGVDGVGAAEDLTGKGCRDASSGSSSSSTCPRCAGEGCDHCAGYGRLIDDEPEEPGP